MDVHAHSDSPKGITLVHHTNGSKCKFKFSKNDRPPTGIVLIRLQKQGLFRLTSTRDRPLTRITLIRLLTWGLLCSASTEDRPLAEIALVQEIGTKVRRPGNGEKDLHSQKINAKLPTFQIAKV